MGIFIGICTIVIALYLYFLCGFRIYEVDYRDNTTRHKLALWTHVCLILCSFIPFVGMLPAIGVLLYHGIDSDYTIKSIFTKKI